MDFRQSFVINALWDKDELTRFWGQKVKGQGHIIVVEASSTQHCRRAQLSSYWCLLYVQRRNHSRRNRLVSRWLHTTRPRTPLLISSFRISQNALQMAVLLPGKSYFCQLVKSASCSYLKSILCDVEKFVEYGIQ